MKVLHVITGLNDGGAEGVLTRLCLNSGRVNHVVISLMDEGKYGPLLKAGDIPVHCINMKPGMPGPVRLLRLIRLIRQERPDLVQTWMYHADLLGGLAARLAGIKRVFWGIRMSSFEKRKSTTLTFWIARLCARLSNWLPEKIICCANKAADVHADLGYEPAKLVVIPNGYDLSRFKPDEAAGAAFRVELGLSDDDFVVGKVGRFDPQKDHANLLTALARVAEQKVNFHCVLIGNGLSADNKELTGQIQALRLEHKVLLVGPRNDIPAVMNGLDLHVLASRSEGFPNVIAEAMACGTPCISTDVGDAREILGESDNCCPPEDPGALADLIVKLADEWRANPAAWNARQNAGIQRIAHQYSLDSMVQAYETCWLDAASHP